MIPPLDRPLLDREAFAQAIADRLTAAGGWPPTAARELAETVLADLLDFENIAFGAPGLGWTTADAHDLADEEIFEMRRAS